MKKTKLRNPVAADWLKGVVVIIVFSLVLITPSLFFAFAEKSGLFEIIFGLWIVMVVVVTGSLVYWHNRLTGYRCPICSYEFTVDYWTDFFGPNSFHKKFLKCPRCLGKSWMTTLIRINRNPLASK